jgi:HD-GYP domain-containing protein (c-di-GMP phosphodiesterase class II)
VDFVEISERKRVEHALKVSEQNRVSQLMPALRGTIGAIAQTMELRDPYTAGHQKRVAALCVALARELGLPDVTSEGLETAARVHGIGKIGVTSELLSMPRRLTEIELLLVKEHARIGYELLLPVELPWPIADVIVQHHERFDGSGYPAELKGDAVRKEALILGVADVVEAMASHRPYGAALGIDAALAEITANRGRLYGPDAVEACLRLFREEGYHLEA